MSLEKPDLSDSTAFITGTTRGIGKSLALSLAEQGCNIVSTGKTSENNSYGDDKGLEGTIEQTARECEAKGVEALPIELNVRDEEVVQDAVDRAVDHFGEVNVLINNVGDFEPVHWETVEWSRWREVTATNYEATVLCSRRALAPMREAGWGRVVNVGYASGDRGVVSPDNFPFFVAKAGVLMFTRMVAADTEGEGITANAVSPYVVDQAVDHFGEVNILINNASAIQPANVEDLPAKRFDLLTDVNVRGAYITSRAFIPHLREASADSWILTNAPPVRTDRKTGGSAYAWSKMGMSFVTLSMAGELAGDDIGCNSFWPVTAIDTRATRHFGMGTEDDWRSPEIVSDTVLEMLNRDPAEFTGNAVYDEDFLIEAGVTDFSQYNLTEGDPHPMSATMVDPDYERPEALR